MAADAVPTLPDLSHEVGIPIRHIPHHEKGGPRADAVEEVEKLAGDIR